MYFRLFFFTIHRNYMIKKITPEETLEIRQKVLWPNQSLDYVQLPEDKEGVHYGYYAESKLVSVISLFIKGDDAQFRKFATLESHQGNGYGTDLLSYLFKEVETMNVKRLWCNARTSTLPFYERFGMKLTEHTFLKGDVEYVIMETMF